MNTLKRHLACRRTLIAFVAIGALFVLGWRGADVSEAIAAVAIGLAASNAYQWRGKSVSLPQEQSNPVVVHPDSTNGPRV